MSKDQGRSLPLSVPRRIIGDLMHFSKKIPSLPVQRSMNIAPLVHARGLCGRSISWAAIFIRAYAQTALAFPPLRRSYLSFPFAHLYEHAYNVASVAIERDYEGEPGVFFAHLHKPEEQTLASLDEHLRRFKKEPLENYGLFRRYLRTGRLPTPIRRFLWWVGLNGSGPKRAKRIGTFGFTVYSGLGAESLHPLSVLTTTLNYGVISPAGDVTVRICYDHRVLDGSTVARALGHLENVLNTEMVAELSAMASQAA